MAGKEQYYIYVDGEPVEVSPDVYHVFYGMKDQEKEQEQKKARNGVLSYDAIDSNGMLGRELFSDIRNPTLDERLISAEVHQKLTCALEALPRKERELIEAIYYQGIPAFEYANKIGLTTRAVDKRRVKILSKLKSFMNV